jgi:hypothetical protein
VTIRPTTKNPTENAVGETPGGHRGHPSHPPQMKVATATSATPLALARKGEVLIL